MQGNEQVMTLKGLARAAGLSYAKVYRWATSGYNGVRLEYSQIGGRVFSSREALERFFRKLDEMNGAPPSAPAPALSA